MRNFIFLVAISALAALNSVDALKCWRCNSDAGDSNWCNDKFDSSNLASERLNWYLVDCYIPSSSLDSRDLMPACKKTVVENTNGHRIISRACSFISRDEVRNPSKVPLPNGQKLIFHETCSDMDGCNGVSTITAPKIGILLAILTIFGVYSL